MSFAKTQLCHEQDASFQPLGTNVTGGAPKQIRYLFIVAVREHELDDSALYDLDFSKMREGGLAAACPAFVHAKASGQLDANMGRMPVMLVDGVPIGQIPVIKPTSAWVNRATTKSKPPRLT